MDIERLKESIKIIRDPRREWGNFRHKLMDILVIGLCTIICGGEDYDDMEEFAREREVWLRGFLELQNGIPDGDTFRRVFERVDSVQLRQCLEGWLREAQSAGGRLVSIDGKTIRASRKGENSALHVVSAFAHDSGLVLGEVSSDEKSNEITAIPKLLEIIDIQGDIVTIDAMGTQTKIAEHIRRKEADYVLAVKQNQPTLHDEITDYFNYLEKEAPLDEPVQRWESKSEQGHGRIERREITAATHIGWITNIEEWTDAVAIVRYRCTRTLAQETSQYDRYYISSFDTSAEEYCYLLRNHWAIENNLHWMLDVIFHEDRATARKDNSALNMNVLRKMAMECLKKVPTQRKFSVQMKMFKAALNTDFLYLVIFGNIWCLNALALPRALQGCADGRWDPKGARLEAPRRCHAGSGRIHKERETGQP